MPITISIKMAKVIYSILMILILLLLIANFLNHIHIIYLMNGYSVKPVVMQEMIELYFIVIIRSVLFFICILTLIISIFHYFKISRKTQWYLMLTIVFCIFYSTPEYLILPVTFEQFQIMKSMFLPYTFEISIFGVPIIILFLIIIFRNIYKQTGKV